MCVCACVHAPTPAGRAPTSLPTPILDHSLELRAAGDLTLLATPVSPGQWPSLAFQSVAGSLTQSFPALAQHPLQGPRGPLQGGLQEA